MLDPITFLQKRLREVLAGSSAGTIERDGILGRKVPWRPHLLERKSMRAWYIHVVEPTSDSWQQRIERAKKVGPKKLRIAVAATEELLSNEKFLLACHSLEAQILPFRIEGNGIAVEDVYASVEDYICETRTKLSLAAARELLDRALERALKEKNRQRKGILLELLAAVLLSQVDGFEISEIGIANRSQQMDVLVHNRNASSALGLSPIVLVEAKNWKEPVGTEEYAAFVRKLESRHGRAHLGYIVTTSKFTVGVDAERRRESKEQTLVVLIDGVTLPTLWRGKKAITEMIEKLTIRATVGS